MKTTNTVKILLHHFQGRIGKNYPGVDLHEEVSGDDRKECSPCIFIIKLEKTFIILLNFIWLNLIRFESAYFSESLHLKQTLKEAVRNFWTFIGLPDRLIFF